MDLDILDEAGGIEETHMKINLPIFKDEDAKDTVTYQSWRWDLTVYQGMLALGINTSRTSATWRCHQHSTILTKAEPFYGGLPK